MAGFFSGLAKQKFGQVPGYLGGQGIGDGRIEQQQYDMMQDQGGAMQPDMGSMTRKPFFQRSGVKQGLGILGDTLSILGGGQATYAPAMVDQRKQDAEIRARLQAQSEQRKAGREDYAWKAQYDRDNPAPRQPHYFETNDGSQGMIDPITGEPKILYKDPTKKPQYIQVKDPVTGELRIIDANAVGQSAAPQFAGWPDEGGQTGNPSGNFPR